MKRLMIILVLAVVAMAASGSTTLSKIRTGETYKNWETNYTITNTTVSEFEIEAKQHKPVTVSFAVDLAKGTGSHTDCSVVLYGKCFDGGTWEAIGTATSGTITTTYHLEITSSVPKRFRFFKVAYTGTGVGTTTIDSQELKLWIE